jgi:hypothetical protein
MTRSLCALALGLHRWGASLMYARLSTIAVRRLAALSVSAALLCSGCIATVSVTNTCSSCGNPVGDCAECCQGDPGNCGECCECPHESCSCTGCNGICKGYCCGALHSVAGTCEPCVCWPRHKICHLFNFCAPEGWSGPLPDCGPGRFHPVPTHPVFQPGCDTPPYPTE